MRPMLAFKYQDYRHLLTPPYFIQPKLNGVRALFSCGNFQSRDEKLWKTPVLAHLTHELLKACPPSYILDGELYVHGWSLQQINSAVSVNRLDPGPRTKDVEYHVFDIIDTDQLDAGFAERAHCLMDLRDRLAYTRVERPRVRTVETTRCKHAGEEEFLYSFYRQSGYEGLMYRQAEAPYGFAENCGNKENRWKCLLKRKDWLDDEFEILDFRLTEGEKGNQGFQLTYLCKNGRTGTVGSGLSQGEQEHYSRVSPVGRLVKIKYEMLSDEGIPLKPTIEMIYDEE